MSLRTALSGLNAASTDLNVTSNNIANVSTAGFKQSRAEFGDLYAASIFGVSRNTAGSGVRVTGITQQFTQGSIEFTNRSLDMAISGGGFFTLSNNGSTVYSRAGNFQLNRDGFVVNPQGARLQVFPPVSGADNTFETGRLQDLQLITTDSAPTATTSTVIGSNLPANGTTPAATTPPVNGTGSRDSASFGAPTNIDGFNYDLFSVTVGATTVTVPATTGATTVAEGQAAMLVNLRDALNAAGITGLTASISGTSLSLTNASSAPITITDSVGGELGGDINVAAQTPTTLPIFDPNDTNTFNHSTSITVYDSLGVAHVQTMYYVKTPNLNEWQLHTYVDGTAVGGAQTLQYDANGALVSPFPGLITLPPYTPSTGAADINVTLDLGNSTQFGQNFTVNDLRQDGYTTGRLIGLEVSQQGIIFARYTNGVANPLGQVAMSTFPNQQGLQSLGDNVWSQTFDSGDVRRGAAGTSDFGLVQSGALESSNVELTEQLVNMIVAQRNFQANAQMIQTNDQIQQTVINLR